MKTPVTIQACRPADRAILATPAGQALVKAVVEKVRTLPPVSNRERPAPRKSASGHCRLPCNEHALWQLRKAILALQYFDDNCAAVTRIELDRNEPTLHLQQSPGLAFACGVSQLVRTDLGSTKVKVARTHYMGCCVEWPLP